ncbi:ABC transporter substrate-binding protein [Spirillospora sp. CA-294931]|uniref:ABC transporter substrate-binding protein n=1 Tax=Spirillospora sp. CA-294931 TaxID=3240042 RepID=UPI003D942DA0
MAVGGPGRTAGAVLAAAVLGVTGCEGARGGDETLRVLGSADVDHLDTASGYTTWGTLLTRQFARTLFGFRGSRDFQESITVRPDVAAELPDVRNGGLSGDRRTYTIRLRPGVRWDSAPPREVVAGDFVRGIKRVCNPASPSGGKAYYTETIEGMEAFCAGFAKVDPASAAAIARYANSTPVAGLRARDDRTLVVRLRRPAADFPNILAMSFASAAPAEYDRYVPDSPRFRAHTVSSGPYKIVSYTPNKQYTLGRNPAWRQETDPLRAQNVDTIQITLGQDSPDVVQQRLEQGSADLAWDQPVPTAKIPGLRSRPGFRIQDGAGSTPYLVFNTLSPNNGGALGKRAVRQAIQYAIDKTALTRIYGGAGVARPLNQIIPPGSVGHRPINLYPTPGDSGDPARCRRLLADAGHPGGLTLKFPYRVSSNHPRVAQSVQANLKACGITAELTADSGGTFYSRTLVTPSEAKAGKWDVAAPGWQPDWYGNNGRSTIVALFDGRHYGPNSTNYGGYDNDEVNRLIDRALGAGDTAGAAGHWAEADRLIMRDAAVVPFMHQRYPIFHSARVGNALFVPQAQAYDLNQIRLS